MAMRLFFVVMVFIVPVLLLGASNVMASASLPVVAFAAQYLGLMAERWYFFVEAKHPQNLYYQTVG
jgi:DMSO reductase anchor subunit